MLKLTRVLMVLGFATLLQACTAASGLFDNNCSDDGMIDPGASYCSSYTHGTDK